MTQAALEWWRDLDSARRRRVVVATVVVVYLLMLVLGGSDGVARRRVPLGILALGVIYGTVTALGAMGIILVYKANRFINFAHGALGSMVGVLAIGLVIEHGLSYWIALPMAVVVGAAVGALVEFLVIRRFRHASRLVATVASIGLAQVLGGLELIGSKAIGFVSLTGGFKAPLDLSFQLDVKRVQGDEILVVTIVPLVIGALAWFLLKTDAGVAVRGAAENVDRALLLGIPVPRLSTIVWLIAGGLAALTFMLQAPFAGVKPGVAANGPTVLLPLLAAAVVARMESLPMAFAAGIGLGITDQLVRWNAPSTPNFVYVIYLLVIVGSLVLQRDKLSRAHDTGISSWNSVGVVKQIPRELRGLPEVRWGKAGILTFVALLAVFVPAGWASSSQQIAAFAVVWGMIAVSLVALTGWGGNISLGQFGIAGMGGMLAGNLIADHNTDFWLVVMAAGAAGALMALLVGLPALRIRGLFLAVTTLAFAMALDGFVLDQNQFPSLMPTRIGSGYLLQRWDMSNPYTMYLVCLSFLVLSILAALGVRKARNGRVLIATRDNYRAADSVGVDTTRVKLSGFLLSGTIAGVAGALYVVLLKSLGQGSFNPADSITVFSTAVIGGLGSIAGALIGVLLFKWLETMTWLGDLRLAINGAGLLAVLYLLPGGLGQLVYTARDRALARIAERRGILVPSLVADRRVDTDDDHAADESDLLQGALAGAGAPR
ncbi:MAG: ABC transporter permease [Actinomycetota bacterium]|nr:ABC transporter permease [Actinomycetota bacterium]